MLAFQWIACGAPQLNGVGARPGRAGSPWPALATAGGWLPWRVTKLSYNEGDGPGANWLTQGGPPYRCSHHQSAGGPCRAVRAGRSRSCQPAQPARRHRPGDGRARPSTFPITRPRPSSRRSLRREAGGRRRCRAAERGRHGHGSSGSPASPWRASGRSTAPNILAGPSATPINITSCPSRPTLERKRRQRHLWRRPRPNSSTSCRRGVADGLGSFAIWATA